ncbi:MAG: acyl-CoA thioesterase [Huintestinicola sp.]
MKLEPYSRKVTYYETDKMGIVHHSNYIRWFEETRVSLIEQAGLPFETVEAEGIFSPVLSAECSYKLPFRFNDRFFVKARITDFGGARFNVEYIVYDEADSVHCTGKTSHCFVDSDMRPVRIKKVSPHVFQVYNDLFEGGYELFE